MILIHTVRNQILIHYFGIFGLVGSLTNDDNNEGTDIVQESFIP